MSNFVGNKPNPLALAIQGAKKLLLKLHRKHQVKRKLQV